MKMVLPEEKTVRVLLVIQSFLPFILFRARVRVARIDKPSLALYSSQIHREALDICEPGVTGRKSADKRAFYFFLYSSLEQSQYEGI